MQFRDGHCRSSRRRAVFYHVTLPSHDPIKLGTLNAILRELAEKNQLSRDELLRRLFP